MEDIEYHMIAGREDGDHCDVIVKHLVKQLRVVSLDTHHLHTGCIITGNGKKNALRI